MGYDRKKALSISKNSLGNKYEFIKKKEGFVILGEGGSGIVYKANQVFDKSQNVVTPRAIKFFAFRNDLSKTFGYASKDNFETEIVNITRFNHQNILKVIDGDYYTVRIKNEEVRIPYTVTEYIEGCTLENIFDSEDKWKDWLRDEECVFDIFSQIAKGLIYLHMNSFFHCDIAPKNIFLKKDSSEWFAVIGDLGAGRTISGKSKSKFLVVGTKEYMPENAREYKGEKVELNTFKKLQPEWDIFSFKKTMHITMQKIKDKGCLNDIWHLERLDERITNTDYSSVKEVYDDIELLRPSGIKIFRLDELSEASNKMRQVLIPINRVYMSFRMYSLTKHDAMLRLMNVPELLEGSTTFPAANHTRYEHSLGTYELMRKAILTLLRKRSYASFFDERTIIIGLLSALLSSIVHYPFSYAAIELHSQEESLLENYNNREIFSKILNYSKDGESLFKTIRKLFLEFDIKIEEIEYVLFGKKENEKRNDKLEVLYNLLNSSVGVRIIDYMMRDSYHIGIKYNIDTDSLFSHMSIHDNEFCVKQKGISSAEQIIINRYWLFKRIYWCEPNRTNVALLKYVFYLANSKKMVRELTKSIPTMTREKIEGILSDVSDCEKQKQIHEIFNFINKKGQERYVRILAISKEAAEKNAGVIWLKMIKKSYTKQEKIRKNIEDRLIKYLNIQTTEVAPILLLDIPYDKQGNKLGSDIKIIKYDGGEEYLTEISTTIKGINEAFNNQLTILRVYLRPDIYKKYIKESCEKTESESRKDVEMKILEWLYDLL